MNVFNQIIKVVSDALPIVQPVIPSIVGGFITAMFLRGNTQRVEFEKIKLGKIQEAVNDLVNSRELTLTELVKCKNLLKIAEFADREYRNNYSHNDTNSEHDFDFDWFLRFFEGAGNISNEDMQHLWARILAGEVSQKGTFSLRTLETLRNMTQSEALLVQQAAQLILTQVDREKFIYCDNLSTTLTYEEEVYELNQAYGVDNQAISVLTECDILSSAKKLYRITFFEGAVHLYNGNIIIIFHSKSNDTSEEYLEYYGYEITQIGLQIISILDVQPVNNYILDLGLILKKKYPDLEIQAFGIKAIENNNVIIDPNINVLHDYKNEKIIDKNFQWK